MTTTPIGITGHAIYRVDYRVYRGAWYTAEASFYQAAHSDAQAIAWVEADLDSRPQNGFEYRLEGVTMVERLADESALDLE
jgi:hypothetical protein